ncbi:MAG: Zn-ribbon domain-containing OB-fold protein [Candidatus Binataceae bacterium]
MAAHISKPIPVPTVETRPYWEGCRRHELLIQRCAECGHHQFFPRIYCAQCFSDRVEWARACGRAKVLSFTIVRRPVSPAFADEVPYVIALVTLEEGPTMMTNIIGCSPETIEIGMPVKVTFERWTEEISIPKFQPL